MVKRQKRYESVCLFDFFFSAGGGAAQVPYGNAPVIPTGLEGKIISGLFSMYHLIKMCKLNFCPQPQFQGPQNAVRYTKENKLNTSSLRPSVVKRN